MKEQSITELRRLMQYVEAHIEANKIQLNELSEGQLHKLVYSRYDKCTDEIQLLKVLQVGFRIIRQNEELIP